MELDCPAVRELIRLAIQEDLNTGDITSQLCLDDAQEAQAIIIAREELLLCGVDLIDLVLAELRFKVACSHLEQDGAWLQTNQEIAKLQGKTRDLLGAERIILNFLQRLSGVATFTNNFVKGLSGITVLDTRKTTPGWRVLEKYAVRVGGAKNHRASLGDMMLIKNNHIDAAKKSGVKDIGAWMRKCISGRATGMQVEIEVRDQDELKSALEANPDFIMLDNMNDAQVAEAVKIIRTSDKSIKVEVSGGVGRERLAKLSEIGVDLVSVGALTRKATWVDISMRIV